ncbi:putative Enoyl CoA hydratase isomerase [Trypanosoma vivax]|uniref:Enoyl-CoA delta isomerase 1, mitochondrial n=1 Tax=Trypanosoma vivax (strain Y486) TaxID=1055687 RepID=G0TZR0_TRYVY|nr:putative 3,2-trans-enoyl-CoA isomerase, precursor [Trypanosoma vivax]KAH8617704.1 putative Enoyl CoA hydratase isomerase [Trypanosoma vivax]CCC50088.1 putative 3,2-trans-enoyl-CoA isomerase, mitochondrial precursor [Trypanosoma vivax Y486]
MRRHFISFLGQRRLPAHSETLALSIGNGIIPGVTMRQQSSMHGPPGNIPPGLRGPPPQQQHQVFQGQPQFHPQGQQFSQQQHFFQQQQQQQQQHQHQQQQAMNGGSEEDFEPPKKPLEPPKLLKIDTNARGITVIELSRAPVNSLNMELFEEFNSWMLWLGSDEACRSVILTSSIPTVFSAGVDMNEMYNPQPERLRSFWKAFQEAWLILNSFPKPIIAGISGNSPAGGCTLALGCDSRVMARHPVGKPDRPYRIGLNETKLGIAAPPWVIPAYAYIVGSRNAERMLQLGETPTADEALRIGLVDVVVEDEQLLRDAAVKEAERFMAVPQQARWMSRDMLRREFLQFIATEEDREYDTQFFVELMMNPEVQKGLDSYIARLKGKTGKK